MSVEKFDPKTPAKSGSSIAKESTTLDIPAKIIEEQHQDVVKSSEVAANQGAKVGFVSLGCPKGTHKDLCASLI